MLTTRIEISNPDGLSGPYPTRFRRVIVNWHRNRITRFVTSPVLLDTAPPEEVARALRDLANRIERDCRGLPTSEPNYLPTPTWASFVEDVNRLDQQIKEDNIPQWFIDCLRSPGDPEFAFQGWKVFRR